MTRSRHTELLHRINAAYALAQEQLSAHQILDCLSARYGVSRIQAYRYLQRARELHQPCPVPEPAVVLTLKLPPWLIRGIKAAAAAMGLSRSKVAEMALEEFLTKRGGDQKEETC